MNNLFRSLLVTTAILAVPTVHGAQPAAAPQRAAAALTATNSLGPTEVKLRPTTLTAAQIVERYAAARGGLDSWRKIATLATAGKMDAGRARQVRPEDYAAGHKRPLTGPGSDSDRGTMVQVPFVMEFKRPRKARVEIDYHGQKAVQVYDGTKGYKLRPFLNRADWQLFSAEEAKAAAMQQELDGPLLDYVAKGTKIAVEGMGAVEAHDAYRLKLTFKDGQDERLWVDATSFLEVRIDTIRKVSGRPRSVVTYLRDYRTVNGVKIPFLSETQVEGRPDPERIVVETATVNPTLDDSRFVPPLDGVAARLAVPKS